MNFEATYTAKTKTGFSFPVVLKWNGVDSPSYIATIGGESFSVTPGFDPNNGECVTIRNKKGLEALGIKADSVFSDFQVDVNFGDYSTTVYFEGKTFEIVAALEAAEKEIESEKSAKEAAKNAELAAKFEQAKATGEPVLISRQTEIEDVKGGEMYHTYTRWAMPDGTEKTTSSSLKMD